MMNQGTFYGVALGFGLGICVGYLFRGRISTIIQSSGADRMVQIAGESGDLKLVLIVRNDLKMGKGKIAAQCSHATLSSYEQSKNMNPDIMKVWAHRGQPKVVVKTNSEEELLQLAAHAQSLGLVTSLIQDAGRTQIAAGTITVLGVGPAPLDLIDKVTGHLKLM